MGCDEIGVTVPPAGMISTHTSRVGCDLCVLTCPINYYIFLLTHPVWDVTSKPRLRKWGAQQFLLTHPVWDVTEEIVNVIHDFIISTHTSRVGCDFLRLPSYSPRAEFLLTHPVWDVTTKDMRLYQRN